MNKINRILKRLEDNKIDREKAVYELQQLLSFNNSEDDNLLVALALLHLPEKEL